MNEIDPNTLSPEEYAAWKRKHVMEGVVVPESHVAQELGFNNVEDFRWFNAHVGEVSQIIEKELRQWFGNRNHCQISFTTASAVLEYFIARRKSDEQAAKQ